MSIQIRGVTVKCPTINAFLGTKANKNVLTDEDFGIFAGEGF